MSLRDRSISKYEVDSLFRDVLTIKQREKISKVLKIIAKYKFIDKDILYKVAEKEFNEKIGLSFIQKAVKYKLISELREDTDLEKYYFTLKSGSFYFLETIDFEFLKLPIDADIKYINKIYNINKYLIEKGMYIRLDAPSLYLKNAILLDQNKVAYWGDDKDDIVQKLFLTFYDSDECNADIVFRDFEFIKIPIRNLYRLEINENIKGVKMSQL